MLLLKVSLFLCFVLNVIATSSVSTSKNLVAISANKAISKTVRTNFSKLLQTSKVLEKSTDISSCIVENELHSMFAKKTNLNLDFRLINVYWVSVDKETLIVELSKYEGIHNFVIYGYDENSNYYEHFFSKESLCSIQ